MMALLSFIISLGIIWSILYFQTPLKISTIIMGALLFLLSIFQIWSWWILIPLWIIFLVGAVVLNISSLRRDFLTIHLLKKFKSELPHISKTEQEALEAGDVWWEGDLFRGKPDWKKLLSYPKPTLTSEEQLFLDNQVNHLCSQLDDWKIVHELTELPEEVWDYVKQEKFLGLVISKEYGGLGFSPLAHSAIITKIASRSISAAVSIMVPNSLGPGELISHYGTSEQKNYYLPRLASGQEIPCFGLTAPEAGSDATSMTDNGIICRQLFEGKETLGIRLNWNKRYITLAPIATVLGLAFKLYDPEHLIGTQENIGITLALIPTHLPGIEIGKRHYPSRLGFLNGPVRGKDVFIPIEYVIGGQTMCGKGWQILMECLAIGRGISLPALGTAVGQLSYRTTGAYAKVREQFKVSIGKLEGVQEALSRIGGFTYLCEATRLMSANAVNLGARPALASAITKYHLTELGRRIINDAMDVHGGKAIQMGEHNYLGLLYDAVPTSITVEGANILTRNLIIFGQGALRCHPYIRREIQAANENNYPGLIRFDKLIFSHIGFVLRNFVAVLGYGLTGGYFIQTPKKSLKKYYQQLTRMSSALALTTDFTVMLLGGDLKRKERLSARLGDVLSYLYLASSVIVYYENNDKPANELSYVNWALQWCLTQIQEAFDDFFLNFPNRFIAHFLYRLIFPWGRVYRKPEDDLGQTIAEDMQKNHSLRERLTLQCYINEQDGIYNLEKAFQMMLTVEPLQRKLHEAIRAEKMSHPLSKEEELEFAEKTGIFSDEEIKSLRESFEWHQRAIAVDEFDSNMLGRNRQWQKKQKQFI